MALRGLEDGLFCARQPGSRQSGSCLIRWTVAGGLPRSWTRGTSRRILRNCSRFFPAAATVICRRSCSAVTSATVSIAVGEADSPSGTTTPMNTAGETSPPMILERQPTKRAAAGARGLPLQRPARAASAPSVMLGTTMQPPGGKAAMTPRTVVAALTAIAGLVLTAGH